MMVNRLTIPVNSDIERRNSQDAFTAPPYPHDRRSARKSQNNNNIPIDDLIVSLANADENRRARQATEWERMRRQNFSRVM